MPLNNSTAVDNEPGCYDTEWQAVMHERRYSYQVLSTVLSLQPNTRHLKTAGQLLPLNIDYTGQAQGVLQAMQQNTKQQDIAM